jgi:hypothetical protein
LASQQLAAAGLHDSQWRLAWQRHLPPMYLSGPVMYSTSQYCATVRCVGSTLVYTQGRP